MVAALILAALLAACATPRGAVPSPVLEEVRPSVQVGYASWYGVPHHGRRTASGDIYNMYELTAAHPVFRMGTRLHVTNLENGRSVEVRVNDRGPFVNGRILDLSYAAASQLGAVDEGVIRVRIRVITAPTR